jgi:PTH1 family peptidyl-tRNA hydrolase
MNLSGDAVGRVLRFYKFPCESILVVHDELDFPPGVIRLKKGGGSNSHNGVQNIIDRVGDDNFWRMRIGIGKPENKHQVQDYVLHRFRKIETTKIQNAINKAVNVVPDLILGKFEKAMTKLHSA